MTNATWTSKVFNFILKTKDSKLFSFLLTNWKLTNVNQFQCFLDQYNGTLSNNLMMCKSKSNFTRQVSAEKPFLPLNLRTNELKVTSKQPLVTGQMGCIQERGDTCATHPSVNHAQHCLTSLLLCLTIFRKVKPSER